MQLEKTYEEKERGIVKQEDWDSLDRLMSRMTDLKELADRIDVALKGSSAVRRDQTVIGESEDEAGTEAEGQSEPNMPEELSFGGSDTVQSDLKWKTNNWIINPE